ncbi:MAG: carbon starvation protein A [Bacteroidales bacterium]|nr:carbon starvation protein A [Bacteroidales bacterium]
MYSFTICLIALIAGYFIYGKIVETVFGINKNRKTPAYVRRDNVDYVPLPTWKVFMIQFLNIAGVGPIFGAIMGSMFGSASFLWIVLGSIFAGGVHDFLSGAISVTYYGINLPQLHGLFFNNTIKKVMLAFMIIMLILVGAVFVSTPAALLENILPFPNMNGMVWIVIIFIYYFLATLLPIDQLIGRIYPLFGACLMFMAIGIMVMIFVHHPALPEIWQGLENKNPNPTENPIFPMMFISIACGAISGFHATQSPLMARCIKNEKYERPVFYGAMIVEGIVALVWAAAATYFFYDPEVGLVTNGEKIPSPGVIVNTISTNWLGTVGGIIAIIGVVAAAITSGDTAFRSARLIVADFFNINQKKIRNRLLTAAVLFLVSFCVMWYSMTDKDGFETIWQYFAWSNQTLACVTLWGLTIFLATRNKCYWITLIPAMFMTSVVVTYIFFDAQGINMNYTLSCILGIVITMLTTCLFFWWKFKFMKSRIEKHWNNYSGELRKFVEKPKD